MTTIPPCTAATGYVHLQIVYIIGFLAITKCGKKCNCPHAQQLLHGVSHFVAGMLWNILGMDVLPHQPLVEAGLGKAGAAQLRTDVLDCYNVALPAHILSQHTTKARLAAFISSCLDLPKPSTDINRGKSHARSQAVGRASKLGGPDLWLQTRTSNQS